LYLQLPLAPSIGAGYQGPSGPKIGYSAYFREGRGCVNLGVIS